VFYALLKIYARLMIRLYCRRIIINKPEIIHQKGPILFAANHPNSFLDGIILTTLLDAPLYSLARGDAFKNKRIATILKRLRLLPVYRTSEGAQNLTNNYTTFAACHEVFKKDAAVLIFSEARCVNEWKLRPLRKGTARLAFSSWQSGIDVPVIPLGFNYDSFRGFGKTVHLNFGTPIQASQFALGETDGNKLNAFNEALNSQLQQLVYEAKNDKATQHYFSEQVTGFKKLLLFVPALVGWFLHAPLFYLCLLITHIFFKNSDHYDSVLHSLLLLSYPVYIFLIILLLWPLLGTASFIAVLILPFSAWCWLQLK
jgi:1-acyl-sn-glycerol-3-phosphate acyltransferase